jgi:hypothetical protein
VLAYAAALHGVGAEEFERRILARHLGDRALLDIVRESAQTEAVDTDDFRANLDAALRDGSFRLVLVLDQAPRELVKLVGYLEAVTQGLVIDLVTVTSYDVAGRRVVVPQRWSRNDRPDPLHRCPRPRCCLDHDRENWVAGVEASGSGSSRRPSSTARYSIRS